MKINYSSFEKAIRQLEKGLSFLNSEMSVQNADLREQLRAAVIQAFEYTYELAITMIRRQLGQIVANPSELRQMAFMDLMRTAYEAGIIQDARPFKTYREMRNITSHTYAEESAEQVISVIADFLKDMRFVLDQLQRRNP